MARAKKTSQAKPAEWTPHEENELLAWLDYNLRKSDGFASFKESVSKHLNKECNVSYTYEQCRRKLYSFWKSYGDETATKVAVLHECGTKCLTHLPEQRKDFIFGRTIELADRPFGTPRRLRSTSRISETPSRHSVDVGKWPSFQSPHRDGKRYGSKLKFHSVTIPATNHSEVGNNEEQHRKRRCLRGQKHHALPNNCIPEAESGDSTFNEASSHYSSSTGESESASSEGRECSSAADDAIPEMDDVTMVPVPSINIINEDMTSKRELEDLKTKFEALQKQIQLMNELQRENNSRIGFLNSHLREAEDHCRDCEIEIRQLKNENARPVHNTQLEDQSATIALLQKKLDKARKISRFTQLSQDDEIRPWKVEDIRQRMNWIGSLMKQLLFGHDNIYDFDPPDIENDDQLATLVRKCFGMTSQIQVTADTIPVRLSDLSLQAVVRALTAAALCEWVFETDLHETTLTNSILLDEYRSHILTIDGKKSLRNLDFAAHYSLFSGTLFQEYIIPKKAEELANRLSRTLSPFFAAENCEQKELGLSFQISSDYFNTWGSEESIWTARRDKLLHIFKDALKIKYEFVTSSYQFEVALYQPQTPFDSDQMTPETMEGSSIRTDLSGQDLEVKLCLLPAIYALRYDPTEVMYNNFVNRDLSERRKSEQLTEAVVVIGQP